MFRYIALAWDKAEPPASAQATRFTEDLQGRASWQMALKKQGLCVFTTGAKPGVNGVYLLPEERGVIVGKLFRRRRSSAHCSTDLVLSADEAHRILRSEGRSLVQDYWGRYVALMDLDQNGHGVLRDPSGTLPCFWMDQQGVRIVFSWLEDLLALPGLTVPTVNWDGVAAHVRFGGLGAQETALDSVMRVLPGELVRWQRGAQSSVLLWNPVDFARAPAYESPSEAAAVVRHNVRDCVRSWAACYDGILVRLSGGVDSSVLLSCLVGNDTAVRITCVNYHSPGSNSDERRYARLAATRARCELIERERDPDFPLEQVLGGARMPAPEPYLGRLGSAQADAELARAHDAGAMFTGAGGDQLFYEIQTWWPAADYLCLHGFGGGFARAAMDAARLGRVSVWRALRLALSERFRPTDCWNATETQPSLLRVADVHPTWQRDRFVHPALLSTHGVPIGKLAQIQQLTHPLGYYDPYQQAAAPELVNPLLSQPLVELCLQIPTFVLTHGGRGRGLVRQAFAPDLPAEIATRRSKGGMEEHVKAVLVRNLSIARSLLLDGELVRRGILDRAKVEQTLSGRPTTLASHAGEIHAHIAVEAWLARWRPAPARSVST